MNGHWHNYRKAVNRLAEALAAAETEHAAIEAEQQRQNETANQTLRDVIAQRELLEQRLNQVNSKIRADFAIGPGESYYVRMPQPCDIQAAVAAVNEFEQILVTDARSLEEARRNKPERRLLTLLILAVLIVSLAILAAILYIRCL